MLGKLEGLFVRNGPRASGRWVNSIVRCVSMVYMSSNRDTQDFVTLVKDITVFLLQPPLRIDQDVAQL